MTRTILTCSPFFVQAALHELHRDHPNVVNLESIAPGFVYLEAPCTFGKFTQPWRQRLPIYLHHLFPVHAVVPLAQSPEDVARIGDAARQMYPPDAVVQIRSASAGERPYTLADVQQAIAHRQPLYDRRPPHGRVLSILMGRQAAYLGISWATQNLSPYAGGQIPITEPVSNRAGYKLLEALETFGIRLRRGDMALDLGAAPGAWTTLLRQRGLRVTAVAPKPLYPWLRYDTDVIYLPLLAEDYLARCAVTFDLIVNDMRMDAQDSARLMVAYARHLRQDGIAIMTLKLRSHNQRQVMDHAYRLLRKAYKILRVRQLVSNRMEVTLFLRKKA